MTNSGTEKEGGAAGWDRTGGGGEVWAGRQPISFPGRSSPSRTRGPCCQSGSGRNTGRRCGCPWPPRGWVSGGGRTCRRRASCYGTGRGIGENSGRETAGSGHPRPRRRRRLQRPPSGSAPSKARCNAG